jgi:hypothetical protein
MAHFAELDINNIVKRVLVVPDVQQHRGHVFLSVDLNLGGKWIQTSYNSRGGVHYTQVMTGTQTVKIKTPVPVLSSGPLISYNVNYTDISASPLSAVPLSSIIATTLISSKNVTVPIYTLSADGKPHLRYNFASPGFYYDSVRDAFISPKNYNSWVLEASSCTWIAPVPYPSDGSVYTWNESITDWTLTIALSTLAALSAQSVSARHTYTPSTSSIN